jgi:transcriptional regulator with XRE-family HTH domain
MTFDTSAASFTITEQQFADALGVSIQLVRQLRRQGRLPHVRINRRILYLKSDVPGVLEQHRQAMSKVAV